MQPFSEALDQAARNANPKYLNEDEEVLLGFEGPFGFHRLTPRELLSPFLGTLVSVEGIVTKCKNTSLLLMKLCCMQLWSSMAGYGPLHEFYLFMYTDVHELAWQVLL